jgi:uncharacterized membrane protein YoaK (UPF0700 family)
LLVALTLSSTGGYLDAFTWFVHDGVLANTQTANVVLIGVYAGVGQWTKALNHVPPIGAFLLGVVVAHWLRNRAHRESKRSAAIVSLVVEIVFLLVVLLIHAQLPHLAGILGISFAAALQTASFPLVRGRAYSSVMTTGNLRQAAEAFSAALLGNAMPAALREAGGFAAISLAFGLGAALGAFVTSAFNHAALGVPVLFLLLALGLLARPASASRVLLRLPSAE